MSRSSAADPRRALPGLDGLLADDAVRAWTERWGEERVKRALREAIEARRRSLAAYDAAGASADVVREAVLSGAEAALRAADRPSLRRVLNGTGVILHTNLGRAPLSDEALAALEIASGYSNLEYDLELGERGSRYDHCGSLLRELTGAGAVLVVNNNAAAVSLAVNELAANREVVASRGELVEIGGSFRMPDVVVRSGARLVEVGTTNRTRIEDYRHAIGPETRLLLKVHPSNYRLHGFVEAVPVTALVALGRETDVPVLYDLGSGLLRPGLSPALSGEPGVPEAVGSGADLVCWSGDKLLGGPQAGVLLGTPELMSRLRKNPLLRAFRVDKLTLAALEATLRAYRDPAAAVQLPVLRALRESVESVASRAGGALEGLEAGMAARVSVERMEALVGGGSCPEVRLPSAGWSVAGVDPSVLEARCRVAVPPLIGRVEEGRFLIDVRTLLPGEEAEAARILAGALAG